LICECGGSRHAQRLHRRRHRIGEEHGVNPLHDVAGDFEKAPFVFQRDRSFTFPPVGKRGAFIMEFPDRTVLESTFSLVVNDQPVISGVNLRKMKFELF
jgi:hypothetical protein